MATFVWSLKSRRLPDLEGDIDRMAETMEVPVSLLRKIAEAARAFEELEDELEDYLLAGDRDFVARMRRARTDHLSGNVRRLSELKAERCIE